jgi:hypothetical protein
MKWVAGGCARCPKSSSRGSNESICEDDESLIQSKRWVNVIRAACHFAGLSGRYIVRGVRYGPEMLSSEGNYSLPTYGKFLSCTVQRA